MIASAVVLADADEAQVIAERARDADLEAAQKELAAVTQRAADLASKLDEAASQLEMAAGQLEEAAGLSAKLQDAEERMARMDMRERRR